MLLQPDTKNVTDSESHHLDANRAKIGKTLLATRKDKHLSISELAKRSGVSAGMISQIERELANPSIRILEKLRTALGIPLSALLEGGKQLPPTSANNGVKGKGALKDPYFVRREKDRPQFNVGTAPLYKELLSPSGADGMQFMIIEFPPHSKSDDIAIGVGLKAGLVLEGQLHLNVDGELAILDVGDSFQFDSSRPHGVGNQQSYPCRVLWIMGTLRPVHL